MHIWTFAITLARASILLQHRWQHVAKQANTLEEGAIRNANDNTLRHRYYGQVLPPSGSEDAAILDMCSSWVSHYPKGYKLARIAGAYSTSKSCYVYAWHAVM